MSAPASDDPPAAPAPLARGSISLRLYPHDLGAADQIDLLRAQAAQGVAGGYDGVMVSEHHADFPGYLPNPVQLAGFLLEAMPRGWAAPCPLLLPMRPYALVAEDLAWLDAAYPGRVGAGFAAGALPVDFELAEVPFDEIVDRFKVALPKVVAALRGDDPTPLSADRAVARTADAPMPLVVAAQSPGAVRRAARLGCGVLYDSLQRADVGARLGAVFREAGGEGPRVLIRRVWIGDPPTAEMSAQMDHYRSYAPEQAVKNWADDSLVSGADGAEAAEALHDVLRDSDADTVNVRIHVKGLAPEQVEEQLELHGEEFLPRLRDLMAGGLADERSGDP
jgi:alkanesulfonate monooxygenase SsuD/methylene tetrahydromethanopterin reductase-like flavin-dependent oxidoreductase (luciferase family)